MTNSIPILLLDLDDTLLGNPMERFVPAYLEGLTLSLSTYVAPTESVSAILAAYREMFDNQNPARTLKNLFDDFFFSQTDVDYNTGQTAFSNYLRSDYSKLETLTRQRPQAIEFVTEAVRRGYRLVVATNPIFPRMAVEQRLEWAGLSPSEVPFTLITSYEKFHFTKPNPSFFAEILGVLGWPEAPVVMVGNDLENDILAAEQMGLATFWVTDENQTKNNKPENGSRPRGIGGIETLLPWLDRRKPEDLLPDLRSPAATVNTLRATPAAIQQLVDELPDPTWAYKPEQKEWNLTEIICHLRDVERKVNLPRIVSMLNEDNPFLPGMDTDPWAETYRYKTQDGILALNDFTEVRQETLMHLPDSDRRTWERKARHAIFGPTTLLELVTFIASHDRLHLSQVLKVLSAEKL